MREWHGVNDISGTENRIRFTYCSQIRSKSKSLESDWTIALILSVLCPYGKKYNKEKKQEKNAKKIGQVTQQQDFSR